LELKDRLLAALLIFTGIRRGEALGLQWEDIDFDRKLINIRRSVRFAGNKGYIGPTKSKAGVRLIPLEPQLEAILLAAKPMGKYVLGNEFPITEMTYKRSWERICRTISMHGATAHPQYMNQSYMQQLHQQHDLEQRHEIAKAVKALHDYFDAARKIEPQYHEMAIEAFVATALAEIQKHH